MKYFKNALTIITLCTINSVNARAVGSRPAQVSRPVTQQPIIQTQSYKDLVAYVKKAPNVWDNKNGMLRADFVNTMVQKARVSHLKDFQLGFLLKTARDIHGIFSGNANRDVIILRSVNDQITNAIKQQ